MTPGAAGLRRARGRLGPCDPGRPCRAVGGVQKGNRRAAPSGSPRGAVWRQSVRQGHCPEGRRRAFAAPGAQRAVARPPPGGDAHVPQQFNQKSVDRVRAICTIDFLAYTRQVVLALSSSSRA